MRAAEIDTFRGKAANEGKPENMLDKIAEGMWNKSLIDMVLLEAAVDQARARRQDDRDAAAELSGTIGENIEIKRFARFEVGASELASRPSSRVLLKLSGEALMGDRDYGQAPERISAVARAVGEVVETGVEMAIVVGGGNILRGTQEAARGMDRATADYAGMLADAWERAHRAGRTRAAGRVHAVMSAIDGRRWQSPTSAPAIRHLRRAAW